MRYNSRFLFLKNVKSDSITEKATSFYLVQPTLGCGLVKCDCLANGESRGDIEIWNGLETCGAPYLAIRQLRHLRCECGTL